MQILGIDVGGSGIKGAPVDTQAGKLLGERVRIPTPDGAEPQPVAQVVEQIASSFKWKDRVGIGFPAPIKKGVAMMAANVSPKWIGINGDDVFTKITGCDCTLINDADAAGLAEMKFGAGRGHMGTVIMITLGTGIGCALFYDGYLVKNTELGHIEIEGQEAESRASAAARDREDLSWKKYAKRLNVYLAAMQKLFWPDLFIIGGGISKDHDKFLPLLTVEVPVVPAQMLNEAGIIGAAMAAEIYWEPDSAPPSAA
ncbi:MAG TPA: ROK family protein [Anaerolineales bacterium]